MRPVLPRISSQASGFFFLRHQAAARGVFVGQLDESRIRARRRGSCPPTGARDAWRASRERKVFEREIAIADRIEAVRGDARKAEIPREGLAIDGKRAARERAGTERASVCSSGRGRRSVPRRAGMLRRARAASAKAAAAARAACAWFPAWGCRDSSRPDSAIARASKARAPANFAGRILHIHAKFGRDHFIAAAARVEFGAERAELFDQRGFGEMVNVFGFRIIEPGEVRLSAELDFIERGDDLLAFFVR